MILYKEPLCACAWIPMDTDLETYTHTNKSVSSTRLCPCTQNLFISGHRDNALPSTRWLVTDVRGHPLVPQVNEILTEELGPELKSAFNGELCFTEDSEDRNL